ncbi:kinase-like domain-containing protein [Bisporella sp. PMI_857]|nr:kinase-like domain-containing protein [Bisporella sp. PMI_857]
MESDLSLSKSFGGLRIANPDTSPQSETPDSTIPRIGSSPSPPQPEHSPSQISRDNRSSTDPPSTRRHSIFNILRRNEGSAESPPAQSPPTTSGHQLKVSTSHPDSSGSEYNKTQEDYHARAAAAKTYRQSMPPNHQAQQQAQFPPYQSGSIRNSNREYNSAMASRPISGVYSAQPPPNAIVSREPGSYRLRSESSKSSIGDGSRRRDSRAGTAMQAGVPSRELSHRDRSYNHNAAIGSSNGPLPPRRTSSAMPPGANSAAMPSRIPNGNAGPVNDDSGAAVSMQEEYDANGKLVVRQVKKGVKDFVFSRNLGEGSYSTVVLGTDKQTLKEYAIKILDKKHIIKEKKIKYVNIERDTLNRLMEHPGIIRLYYTFQDQARLYYVLDIASGGELLAVLKKVGSFNEECTRFYGAQILDAIEHMHGRGVIHRDLKPENVLLDEQMHIKITDFGTAKLLPDPRIPNPAQADYNFTDPDQESNRAGSFVGTAEYVSPELLRDKHACKASDLWAFGCIIYQLLCGRPPFKAANEYLTFQKIVGLEYEFPPGFPPAARDLIERLLVLDPQRRLSIEHIKNHEFFDGVKFGRSLWRMKAPRLMPYVPPTVEPTLIRLGGGQGSVPQPIATSRTQQIPVPPNGNSRPQPRIITELPPPTQLDIEWSPVLTRDNERILKLGNLMVLAAPLPHSPGSKHGDHGEGHERKGLARFFGGSTTKKRQRLVMVTSSARIIMAAAGGEEKKTKSEISLLASECSWRTHLDAKGQSVWCVDTRGTHYTFEDTKTSVTTGDPAKSSAQEWIESLERAKDIALSQNMTGSYSNDNGFDMVSGVSSPASTLHGNRIYPEGFNVVDRSGRSHFSKSQDDLVEAKPGAKRNRFSKRASKNGLSTPF